VLEMDKDQFVSYNKNDEFFDYEGTNKLCKNDYKGI
jgi:hypothetical protein